VRSFIADFQSAARQNADFQKVTITNILLGVWTIRPRTIHPQKKKKKRLFDLTT
jgi:hypothetical protein